MVWKAFRRHWGHYFTLGLAVDRDVRVCCRQLDRGAHMSRAVWNFLCVVGSGDRALESLWLLWLYMQKRLDPQSPIPAGQEWEQASSVQAGLKPTYTLHTVISEVSRKGKSLFSAVLQMACQSGFASCFSLWCPFVFSLILLSNLSVGFCFASCSILCDLPFLTFCSCTKKKAYWKNELRSQMWEIHNTVLVYLIHVVQYLSI